MRNDLLGGLNSQQRLQREREDAAPRGCSWNAALSILRANNLIEVKGDQLRSTL